MTLPVEQRLERLRGSLPAEEPGARGIERIARNPECTRLRALTIAGITPKTAAESVYGEKTQQGQSPFALAIGNSFERALIKDGAAALLKLLRDAGRLTIAECKVVVMPDLVPGVGAAVVARRNAETLRLLRLKASGNSSAPNLIIKPRLTVTLLGVDHGIEPDAIVAADADAFYRPMELKSYPDRAGKTDPADVRSACRQAAVAVVALRQSAERLGLRDLASAVPSLGDLVLRVPASQKGKLSPMTLQGEVASLERALGEAPRNLDELEAFLPAGASLDRPEVLEAVPNSYRSSCREHCALAKHCKQASIAAQDPILLGEQAKELLIPAGSISRAADLLEGARPRTEAEKALAEQLQEANTALKRAV
jgi:hypothetical protein